MTDTPIRGLTDQRDGALPLHLLAEDDHAAWAEALPEATRAWLASLGFTGRAGQMARLPGGDGAVAIASDLSAVAATGDLATRLGQGRWTLAGAHDVGVATAAAIGWGMGAYAFTRFKTGEAPVVAELVWPEAADRARATAMLDGITLARDLINSPASHLGPKELAAAAETLAGRHDADIRVIAGDSLLEENYPTIHMVGRASDRAPRLIDMRWGDESHPRVTLVGKGVCFDTGGLDLKPPAGMRNMKKDMGGAGTVLGLAAMIMGAGLPVRLRVLVPAVENSVSGNAMRPMDVVTTRKGITVEIGNTDAEGRLVLCDALAEAMGDAPEVLIDMATLTGAARVALGPSLPALFCNDDTLAADILAAGLDTEDPLWRMPLHAPYDKLLEGESADINNISEGGFGGAITAALFLQRFVDAGVPWAHIDMMAWNNAPRPAHPKGGEAQAARALFHMLERRFA